MTTLTEKFRRMRELQKAYAYNTYGGRFHEMREAEAEVDRLLAEPVAPPDPVRIDPAPVYALLRRSLAQMGKWQRKYGEHNPQWLPPDGDVKLAEDIDTMLNQIPAAPQAEPSDEQMEKVRDAIAGALGDAYDCLRVWSAWGVGTMSQDDFSLIAEDSDRLNEIAQAAINALRPAPVAEPKKTSCLLGCHERGQCLADAKGTPSKCRIHPRPTPVAEPAASGAVDAELKGECEARGQLINIVLGMLDAPEYANIVTEVAALINERDSLLAASAPPQPVAQGDYLPLPEPDSWVHFHKQFGEEKMRAFVDADRAARSNLQVGGDVPTDEQLEVAARSVADHNLTDKDVAYYLPKWRSFLRAIDEAIAATPSSTGSEKS